MARERWTAARIRVRIGLKIKVYATLAVLSLALLPGCRQKESVSPAGAPPRSVNREIYEDQFRIGKTAGADGVAQNETNKFKTGEPIYVSFVIRNAPAGMSAKVIWKRLDGDRVMADDEKSLPSTGFVSFRVKDTSGWPPGAYRLIKMVGGGSSGATPIPWKGVGTMDLTISPL
jgi:hypothetical protein